MKKMSDHTKEYLDGLSQSVQTGKPLIPPLSASLQANKICNSRCLYCGIWKNPPVNPSLQDLLLAVDELADLGVHMISLTGGEPFLQSHLPEVVRRMRTKGIISSTMTNGLLLNENYIIPFLEAGLNSLCVSLDTLDPATYQTIRGVPLDPVLAGLKYLAVIRRNYRSLFVFSINCVVSRLNINQLVPLVEFCSELDISVGFQPLHASFESKDNPECLHFREDELLYVRSQMDRLVQMKERGFRIDNSPAYLQGFPDYLLYRRLPEGSICTAGFTTIAVDAELNVKSCWPKKPVGNLHERRLAEIWQSDNYRQHRSAMLALDCPGCWLRCHTDYLSVQWLIDLLDRLAATKRSMVEKRH